MNEWVRQKIDDLEQGWQQYWAFIQGLTPDQFNTRMPEGRTVKEVLAHIAFWEESTVGYVRKIIRGENIPDQAWYGGAELGLKDDDPWPSADVHNAREAQWANSQEDAAVIRRLERARPALVALLESVSQAEADGAVGEYYSGEGDLSAHFAEHLEEIEACLCGA